MEINIRYLKQKLKEAYDINVADVTPLPSMHELYQLKTACSHQYVVKLYKTSDCSLSHLTSISEFYASLKADGVSVTLPVMGVDGGYVQHLGGKYVVLSHFVHGDAVSIINPSQSYLFGRECARLHLTESTLDFPHKKIKELLTFPLLNIKTGYSHKQEEVEVIESLAKQAEFSLSKLNLPEVLCHGDFHWGNAIFSSQQVTILDFDFCCRSWRIYDPVVFLWNLLFSNCGNIKQQWSAFLSGYQSISGFSDEELRAIPWLLVAHNIWHIGFIGEAAIEDWEFDDYWFDRKFELFDAIRQMCP
ncbi:phosphotransferase enzyme family protein [Vibrio alginolyticus]|uniref:phosphotransferase enzyme family protein n=1 Tax=Vibrio TaxID=662 RepID=UPI0005F08977|nr:MULTISPECIES: phosphotransferase [Vibrio]EGR0171530.1 phosphotransferase [Vibrio alginolyticus]ELN6939256.1 phosphotransferase [Vibrio alginolyticus]MDK9779232.1 phosphotransferase [Vibrio sp. D401a]MDK9808926.1 phosphotransferase [Vibrio sp. D406a]